MSRMALLFFFIPSVALGQVVPDENDREADMFGDDFTETEVATKHRDLLDLDRLQVGGMVYMRYGAYFYEGEESDPTLSNPNLLDVYLDGQPNDRVRAYVRGRLTYDPMLTGYGPGVPDISDMGIPEEMLPEPPPSSDVLLDQLWLKFDIGRTLFVTAGKQPVHWGASRLWNPVDVVNSTRREPLTLFDDRTGVAALKVQLPIEPLSWNLIWLALVEDADSMADVGGALRLEMVVATAEIGLTGMVRKETDADGENIVIPKVGLDLSAGIWELDVAGEVAANFVEKTAMDPAFEAGGRQASLQTSGGLSYSFKYSDEDFAVMGGEYFFNSEGYGSKDDYPSAFMNGTFTPFYMGRHYGALYIALPSPGNWDFTSFTLSGIGNLSDESYMTRFDYSTSVLTYLTLQAYVSVNLGQKGGEFKFGFEEGQIIEGSPAVPYPVATAGLNLRVDI